MKNDNIDIKEEQKKEELKKKDLKETEHECKCAHEKEEIVQRARDFENNYKRALADYQNLQKRVIADKQNWILSANKELLLRLLPVLDTLILANNHKEDKDLLIVLAQFQDALKQEGVVKIEALKKKFDPMLMEAIEAIDGDEETVMEEVRTGFLINGQLLRAAQVKVGKKS